jgi:polar amino acid transport system substrate-binding protein
MIKLMLNIIAITVWQLSLVPSSFASVNDINKPIQVGSYLMPGLMKEDGTGLFNQLNKAMLKEMNKSAELTLSSMNRARKGIENGTLDAYFPELWENLPGEKEQYIVSRPIFYKRIILFTLKDSGLDDLSSLKDKPLGVVQGFSYGKEITSNPQLNFTFQENDIINIKLLLNKRVSGVLGGFPGTVLAVKGNSQDNKIHYDLSKPVAILESFYVCKNDAEGLRLCNAISGAIESLLQKGILELNPNTGYSRFNSPNKANVKETKL